jgi:hypothetical protein
LQSLRSPDTGTKTAVELKAEIQSAYFKELEEKFPSLRLDYKKDRIYDVKYETIERRVSEGQVAGGVFPLQGRKDDPPLFKVGPGDYEVYDSPTVIGGTFGLQPANRGFDEVPNPEYFPLNERKRLKRIHAQLEKRKADNKTKQWLPAEPEDIRDLENSIEGKAKLHPSFDENMNSIIGLIGYEKKNQYLVFKTRDLTAKRDLGARCDQAEKSKTIRTLNQAIGEERYTVENTKGVYQKEDLCVLLEFLMRYNNQIKKNGKVWFSTF